MEIRIENTPVDQAKADALVVLGFEGTPPSVPNSQSVRELYDSGEFSGKRNEIAILHAASGLNAKRLVLVGAGKREAFQIEFMIQALGTAFRTLKCKGVKNVSLYLSQDHASADMTAAAVEGALLGNFEPSQFKSDPKKDEKRIDSLSILGGNEDGLNRGRIVGESQNLAREIINEPGNVLTPLRLADHARKVAAEAGLDCEVLEQDRMRQLGMGALLGVAQGSAEPPALIILRYEPEAASSQDHLALIGKGVTFDTGGISIKPSEGMEKMKYDMSGGAAVIGAMQAIARLRPSLRVTGFIPAVENMPGSRAQRPGDIVKTLNGKTVEVLNTDAEGRLILIDTLTYAQRQGCTHLVDAATLTGSIVIALGHINIGAFTNNEDFLRKFIKAAKSEGERVWQMPMDEEYKEALKSEFADLQNIGGRPAGSITAAWFLNEFVEGKPWIHLDIAGLAWNDDSKPFIAKGPTGVAVRSFIRLTEDWTK